MSTLAIIPTYMQVKEDLLTTAKCLYTLRHSQPDLDIVAVDDGSPNSNYTDALQQICQRINARAVLKVDNEGFAATVNMGLRYAVEAEQDALFVNADIEFINSTWLDHMQANPADLVGAKLIYPNGLVQHAGIFFSIINRHFDHIHRLAPSNLLATDTPRICPVTGALMLVRYKTVIEVGILDEKFEMGYEDIDYCHRVFQAGLKCAYEPRAVAVHHEGMFRKNRPDTEKHQERFHNSLQHLHAKHAGHSFADYVPTLIWEDE